MTQNKVKNKKYPKKSAYTMSVKHFSLLVISIAFMECSQSLTLKPKQYFDSKSDSHFDVEPENMLASSIFKEIYMLEDSKEFNTIKFNPLISKYSYTDWGLDHIKLYRYFEDKTLNFGFLVYVEDGTKEAVIYKKTSANQPYNFYCTYRVSDSGREIKDIQFNRNLTNIAITTENSSGPNLYYYNFDKNNASGIISSHLDRR
jgi:hypothetical protein